jgi:hypothetical protein
MAEAARTAIPSPHRLKARPMDRLRTFSFATIVALSVVLPSLTANAWMTDANDMDPLRVFSCAGIVLVSLVPFLTSKPWLTRARRRRTDLQAFWVVEFVAALGGLWAVAAPIHPEFGLVVTVIAYLACLPDLRRQGRPTRPRQA